MDEVTTDGKRDIKNILEVVKLIFTILKKFKEQLADGFQPKDIFELALWAWQDDNFKLELSEAFKDFTQIPLEALDLKMSEVVTLIQVVKEGMDELGFKLPEGGTIAKIIEIVKKIYEFIKKFF